MHDSVKMKKYKNKFYPSTPKNGTGFDTLDKEYDTWTQVLTYVGASIMSEKCCQGTVSLASRP